MYFVREMLAFVFIYHVLILISHQYYAVLDLLILIIIYAKKKKKQKQKGGHTHLWLEWWLVDILRILRNYRKNKHINIDKKGQVHD